MNKVGDSYLTMALHPIGVMVLLLPASIESQTTIGGVIVSNNMGEGAQEATVIAVGDRAETVAVGQTILYDDRSNSLSPCYIDGKHHLLIGEHDILARLEDH